MSFSQNFTALPVAGDLTKILLTDTSSGVDVISSRIISFYKTDGTLLSGATVNWPVSAGIGDTISPSVLTKDYSLNIVVAWVAASVNYSKSLIFTSTGYSSQFAYKLTQDISANPGVLNNKNYYYNLFKLQSDIDNAIIDNTYGNQFSAQSALDRVYQMITNEKYYF